MEQEKWIERGRKKGQGEGEMARDKRRRTWAERREEVGRGSAGQAGRGKTWGKED